MRLLVVLVALSLGDLALARGVQVIRARVACRVAQLLQVQKVQQVVSVSYLQRGGRGFLVGAMPFIGLEVLQSALLFTGIANVLCNRVSTQWIK